MWDKWLILAGLMLVIEMLTPGIFLPFWLAIGALLAMLVSFFSDSLVIQLGTFVITSTTLILLTKPLINRYVQPKDFKTNVYTIIGKKAVVTMDIDPVLGKGQIKVDSDIWSAKSENDIPIPKGTEVEILKIEGVHAIVK
jgi:Membrane protein implicated in regulation of membrane protease activity